MNTIEESIRKLQRNEICCNEHVSRVIPSISRTSGRKFSQKGSLSFPMCQKAFQTAVINIGSLFQTHAEQL